MSTKFFTNQDKNSLLKKFEGVFKNMESIKHFDALVGYFRASGYFKVRAFLDRIPKVRILVGINVDSLIKKYHDRGQLFIDNPEETKENFINEIIKNIQDAEYDEIIEKGIVQFMDDLINGKIEVRAHPNKKIHAKVYIFRPQNFNEYSSCEVITGSSNLTDAGLGSHLESNYEFNVALRDYEDVKFASEEFERLWNESVPMLYAEASIIKQKTYLRDDFTPFELYIKMLIEYFGKRVEYDPYNIELLLPEKFMRLKYQSDAANQGYAIMMKHNGFILADVVGLGKTIVACMVIKKFIYENGTYSRVLIVLPPALEASWKRTADDFQIKGHFEFITIGSLSKVLNEEDYTYSNAEMFDLVVVDESHKFRNDYTAMYIALQEICKKPRIRSAEGGDTRKKIILISATPLNNRPQDIENQLYLFQDKRNSTLENIRNLQDYFKPLNEQYKKLSSERELNVIKLKELFQKLRDDVIEPLVIRRTRTDIENNRDYLEDMNNQGIVFPKIDDPIALYYELDGKLASLFYETVSLITGIDEHGNQTDGLGYFRYRAIEFLIKEEDRNTYGNVRSISGRLSTIMKTLLVKRLESSFFAFTQSLSRFQNAIDNMLRMFEQDKVFIAPDLNINSLLEEGYSFDEIEAIINTLESGNNKVFKSNAFDKNFYTNLASEKRKVDELLERWRKVHKDPKLEEFIRSVKSDFFHVIKNQSQKLIIFTESKETAEKLTEHLKNNFPYRILTVSAENRKSADEILRLNFDANLEEDRWKNDFDIVITTEVLAEGINLHRSNTIVNYDVPWNATRLMQRIGRVNRIGSRARQIFVYNFYPSAHGDEQIQLVNNALRKLQSFHTAFGEDNRIFSLLEEKGDSALFGNHIIKEQSEILEYLTELREFKRNYPRRFDEIKKIPNKARCGRNALTSVNLTDDEGSPYKLETANSSIIYFKSNNHPGIFCLVTESIPGKELTFLQAVKLYKAEMGEKATNLHKLHYEQTLSGLEFFKSEKSQADIRNISRKNLSPAENKAISNINALLKFAPSGLERLNMQRALELIRKGTYGSKGLPRSVNEFFLQNSAILNDPAKLTEQLFLKVLQRYNLSTDTDTSDDDIQGLPSIINPQIVLTQSFI